jgi:hypothetical protein
MSPAKYLAYIMILMIKKANAWHKTKLFEEKV